MRYTQLGVYESSMGDTMTVALLNALQMQIVLFTSIQSCPHIPILPRIPPLHHTAIYLALLHACPRHYSLVAPKEDTYHDFETQGSTGTNTGTSSRGWQVWTWT